MIGRYLGGMWGRHIRKKHIKGKEKWTKCYICLAGYTFYASVPTLGFWLTKTIKNNNMEESLTWFLALLALCLVPFISILVNYFIERKKLAAETERLKSEAEKLQLQNKITKEITYDQLKTESKQKDIKGKIEIFSRINKLETEIKSKENKTVNDQKKLEALEAIKKEFKQTFVEEEKPQLEEIKNLETKEESGDNSKIEKTNVISSKKKKKITQSKPTHKSNLLKNKPSKKKKIVKTKVSKKKT